MGVYVLIHGAWSAAWCWRKVVPLLEQAGHTVLAPDLPGHGEDKTPISDLSLQVYADRVCEVVNAQSEPVILVGHSFGGVCITQAAERCPENIKKLVYVAAFLLPNGVSRVQYARDDSQSLAGPNKVMLDGGQYVTIKEQAIIPAFYHDCSEEDIALGKELFAPEPAAPIATAVEYSEEKFGRIPRVYIECLEDRALPPAIQKRMYTETPVAQVISMYTSHSPYFAAAQELAENLLSLN